MVKVQTGGDDLRDHDDWRGLAAIILAAGAAGAVLALAIGSLVVRAVTLSPSEGELLGTVVGATVGAVATWLGGAGRPRRPPRPPGAPYDGEAAGDFRRGEN